MIFKKNKDSAPKKNPGNTIAMNIGYQTSKIVKLLCSSIQYSSDEKQKQIKKVFSEFITDV